VAITRGETMEWSPLEVAGKVVCIGSTATTPAMPYLLTPQGREVIAKSALPTDFPSAQLVTPEAGDLQSGRRMGDPRAIVRAEAGRAQTGAHLHSRGIDPANDAGLPLHGLLPQCLCHDQYLASRGYVVLSVN